MAAAAQGARDDATGHGAPLVQVLQAVLGRPGRRPLCQSDLGALRCVSRAADATVSALCFPAPGTPTDDRGRWYLDPFSLVQPICRPLAHIMLDPLVRVGLVPPERAIVDVVEQTELGPHVSARLAALRTTDGVSDAELAMLLDFVQSRSKHRLSFILSSGGVWAVALRLLRASTLMRPTVSEAGVALLGLNEPLDAHGSDSKAVNSSEPHSALRNCETRPVPRDPSRRSLELQWDICYWLHTEIRVRRNKRVKALLRLCFPKRETNQNSAPAQPVASLKPALVRLLVEEPGPRQAIADGTLDISRCIALYHMCGVGHVRQALTPPGLQALKTGKLSLDTLMRLPKHFLVKAVIRYVDVFPAEAVCTMRAPIPERVKMIELLATRCSPEQRTELGGTTKLLALPTLEALEFVLSKPGAKAVRAGVVQLDELSTSPANRTKVLRSALESEPAQKLLKDGVFTIPQLLRCVRTPGILFVLVSPAGDRALRDGRISLEQISEFPTAARVLAALNSSTLSSDAAQLHSGPTGVPPQQSDATAEGSISDSASPCPAALQDRAGQALLPGSSSSASSSSSTSTAKLPLAPQTSHSIIPTATAPTKGLLHVQSQAVDSSDRKRKLASQGSRRASQPTRISRADKQDSSVFRPRDQLRTQAWDAEALLNSPHADIDSRDVGITDCDDDCALNALVASREAAEELEIRRVRSQSNESPPPWAEAEEGEDGSPSAWDVDTALDSYRDEQDRRRQHLDDFLLRAGPNVSREDALEYLKQAQWDVSIAIVRFNEASRRMRQRTRMETLMRPVKRKLRKVMLGAEDAAGSEQCPSTEPTSEQLGKLMQFFDITGMEKEEDAVQVLRMCDWDLDTAVNTFFAMQSAA